MADRTAEVVEKIVTQQVVKQEKRTLGAGVEKYVITQKGDGFVQTILIHWSHTSQNVSDVTVQLDLGRHGSYTVDFNEYFDVGLYFPSSAQEFWICRKNDATYQYGITMTPAVPVQFTDNMKINMTNNTDYDITLDLVKVKFTTGGQDILQLLTDILKEQRVEQKEETESRKERDRIFIDELINIRRFIEDLTKVVKYFKNKIAKEDRDKLWP